MIQIDGTGRFAFDYINEKSYVNMSISYLQNFIMTIPRVDIEDGVSIVRIRELDERVSIPILGMESVEASRQISETDWRNVDLSNPKFCESSLSEAFEYRQIHEMLARPILTTDCVVLIEMEEGERKGGDLFAPINEKMRNVVTAIRLLSDCNVVAFPRNTIQKSNDWPGITRGTYSAIDSIHSRTPFKDICYLDEADVDRLIKIYRNLTKIEDVNPNMALAISRFINCTTPNNNHDLIIDSMIGLESFFLADASGELNFRFAQRAAYYLASEPGGRPYEFRKLKRLYDIRSKIVHGDVAVPTGRGDSAKLFPDGEIEVVRYAMSALRRSCAKSLESGHYRDKQSVLLAKIDNCILEGSNLE